VALLPGASFCRSCGARYEQPACAACKAPIVSGTAFCRSCGAPLGDAPAAAPSAEQPTVARPVPPASPPPAPPRPPGKPRRTPLLIAVAILLLGAGAAAAIVLTGGEDASPTAAVTTSSPPSDPTPSEEEEGGEEEEFPSVGRAEMEEEIGSLLIAYHEDVVERDFRAAWALLSTRKRQQNLAEYGYREWKEAQESLSDYLSPSLLQARVDALEDEGVARVSVTGMGWSAPSSACAEWSGLTWVRYEGGEWTYDPGYSTTSARRQTWKPRAGELLGADC